MSNFLRNVLVWVILGTSLIFLFNSIDQSISDFDLVIASFGMIDLSNYIECESPQDITKSITTIIKINNLCILLYFAAF